MTCARGHLARFGSGTAPWSSVLCRVSHSTKAHATMMLNALYGKGSDVWCMEQCRAPAQSQIITQLIWSSLMKHRGTSSMQSTSAFLHGETQVLWKQIFLLQREKTPLIPALCNIFAVSNKLLLISCRKEQCSLCDLEISSFAFFPTDGKLFGFCHH